MTNYAHTLEFLIENWPPEEQERMLMEYSEIAGFKNERGFFDKDVAERVEFHVECMNDNYKCCVELVRIIRNLYEPGLSEKTSSM